jgi:predicted DNA binding CopG/RHH family protein
LELLLREKTPVLRGAENPPLSSQLTFMGVKTLAKKLSKETVIIEVQLAKNDYERLVKNASEKGFITLSEYIRNVLRNA